MQRVSFAYRVLLTGILFACVVTASASKRSAVLSLSGPARNDVLFYDDFNEAALDTIHWIPSRQQWGGATNNGVVPQNLRLTTIADPTTGMPITVLDILARGDKYTGPVPGIQKAFNGFGMNTPVAYSSPGSYGDGYVRTGGVVVTRLRYGPARYQVRMRALQQRGGETAIWNYYDPLYDAPGSGNYTEIDIEIPANGSNGNMATAGLNSYSTAPATNPLADAIKCDCVPTNVPNQADGKFHLYEIDWYDGSDGSQPRIEWYFDGVLERTSTTDIPSDPAQLSVGNWPASWSYKGIWDYASQDQYIDYVKISKLPGDRYPTSPPPAPVNLTLPTSSDKTVDLAWQESGDGRILAGYDVLADGVLVEQTSATHIELTDLTPGKPYSFTVKAVNTATVFSAPSNALSVTLPASTPACKANPTSPVTGLDAFVKTKGSNTVRLRWEPPVDGTRDGTLGGVSCSIIGYEITRSSGGTTVQRNGTRTSYLDRAVSAGEYRYDVTPYNQFGTGPNTSVNVHVGAPSQKSAKSTGEP